MLVQDYMTSPAITIATSALWKEAPLAMRTHSIRHLPVLNLHGQLVGIVSDRDILKTTPAPATEAMW
ncbi:MAG: CBS domain-containing protein, partial [Ardenticatenaceae bacterium]